MKLLEYEIADVESLSDAELRAFIAQHGEGEKYDDSSDHSALLCRARRVALLDQTEAELRRIVSLGGGSGAAELANDDEWDLETLRSQAVDALLRARTAQTLPTSLNALPATAEHYDEVFSGPTLGFSVALMIDSKGGVSLRVTRVDDDALRVTTGDLLVGVNGSPFDPETVTDESSFQTYVVQRIHDAPRPVTLNFVRDDYHHQRLSSEESKDAAATPATSASGSSAFAQPARLFGATAATSRPATATSSPSTSAQPADDGAAAATATCSPSTSAQPAHDGAVDYARQSFDMGPLATYKGEPPDAVPLDALPDPSPQILVVTTAAKELKAVLHRLRPLRHDEAPGRLNIAGVSLTIGQLGGVPVAVCQTQQSATDTLIDVEDLLAELDIDLVFVVGIAYGARPATDDASAEGQLVGDILLANKCIDASHFRPSDETELPWKISGNPFLRKLTTNLVRNWPVDEHLWHAVPDRRRPPKVHIGALISAPTLFDDDGTRLSVLLEHLYIRSYKPLGGETELFQIATAAQTKNVDWICAKAVSDFGGRTPKTDDGQELAAATAADFADWLLRQPIVAERVETKPPPVVPSPPPAGYPKEDVAEGRSSWIGSVTLPRSSLLGRILLLLVAPVLLAISLNNLAEPFRAQVSC